MYLQCIDTHFVPLLQDLIEEMKGELKGDFEEVIVALLMESVEYDVHCLHAAVDGLGTDETVLNNILCTRTAEVST